MTAILRLQLDDKDPVRVNSAINQLAEFVDRGGAGGGGRTLLTANTTFYVATTGSNSNPGTAGSPFLTIQHAYDVISNTIDLGGQSVTIQCSSGTYTSGLAISNPWTGGGSIVLDVGGGTISSVSDCLFVTCTLPGIFAIQNATLTSSGSPCIRHEGTGVIDVRTGMTFGSSTSSIGGHMLVRGNGAKIQCFKPYTISGGALTHFQVFLAGNTIQGGNAAVTIVGSITFSAAFAYASRLGCIDIEAATYSAGVTGPRYNVDSNAVIFTNGGGANYFPGTVPGTPSTGGIYN